MKWKGFRSFLNILLLLCFGLASSAQGSWQYLPEKKMIFKVYSMSQPGWPTVKAVLVVTNKAVSLMGVVPQAEYERRYKTKAAPLLTINKTVYVQHEEFLSGIKAVVLATAIDSSEGPKLNIINDYTARTASDNYNDLIELMTDGGKVKILTSFKNAKSKKVNPFFRLMGFSKTYSLLLEQHPAKEREFSLVDLRCRVTAKKNKIVWMDTKHGSYVINPYAEHWLQKSIDGGNTILGIDGEAMKFGRNFLDKKRLNEFYQRGLQKCP
tara:strand:- start:852 stop:1652 length:801 start_codon:yes stop_codon:yes gene_type:complete